MLQALLKRYIFCLFAYLAMFGVFSAVTASFASANSIDIQGIRFGQIDTNGQPATRLVIETSQPARARLLMLENPYRLVVDIDGAQWAVRSLPPEKTLSEGVVAGYRFGYPEAGVGRIVLELSAPARPLDAFRLPPRDRGHRLVVDIEATSATQFLMAKTALLAEPFFVADDSIATPAQTENQPLYLAHQQSPPSRRLRRRQSQNRQYPRPESQNAGLLPLMQATAAKTPGRLG